jgi:hypothetical protein
LPFTACACCPVNCTINARCVGGCCLCACVYLWLCMVYVRAGACVMRVTWLMPICTSAILDIYRQYTSEPGKDEDKLSKAKADLGKVDTKPDKATLQRLFSSASGGHSFDFTHGLTPLSCWLCSWSWACVCASLILPTQMIPKMVCLPWICWRWSPRASAGTLATCGAPGQYRQVYFVLFCFRTVPCARACSCVDRLLSVCLSVCLCCCLNS